MIYTAEEHDWAIKTVIEVDGKQYIVPVQV